MTQIAPIEDLPVRRQADPRAAARGRRPAARGSPEPTPLPTTAAPPRLDQAATPTPPPTAATAVHPRAHSRCGPRPLHRAGLRRHQPAGDRRAAGRHQGGPLLPLRVQGGHPHGPAHAPARVRQETPSQAWATSRSPSSCGASCSTRSSTRCWPSARSSSCTSGTRPPSRSCTARSTTPSTTTSRTSSARSSPTPVSRCGTGSAWRRPSASSSRALPLRRRLRRFPDTNWGPAPRDRPRRPLRMTGPFSDPPEPVLATVPLVTSHDHPRARASLHARYRHRWHGTQGQCPRRRGRVGGRPGQVPTTYPMPPERLVDRLPNSPRSSPRRTASPRVSRAWSAGAACSARRTS